MSTSLATKRERAKKQANAELKENWNEFERLFEISRNDVVKVDGMCRSGCATYVKKEDEANWNNHFSDEAREGIVYYWWDLSEWKSETHRSRYPMPLRREQRQQE